MVGGFHGMLLPSAKIFRIFYLIGRHLTFGQPFKGPAISLGAMGEYHPISATDLSRLYQVGKKAFTRNIPRLCVTRGETLERRHF